MSSASQTIVAGRSSVTRATCSQCGAVLRHVPFSLNNMVCRDCYGANERRPHPVRKNPPAPVVEEVVPPAIAEVLSMLPSV